MFCLSSLEMLSPALTASPIKDDPELHWMPLFISHTHLHVVLSLWLSLPTHRVWKSPISETNFWKERIKAKNERHLCLQNYTHKIIHSSAMYYQNLIIIHECSKELLKMKNNKSLFWHLVWGGIICFGNFPKGTYVQSQSPCWLVIKNTRQVLHIRGGGQ